MKTATNYSTHKTPLGDLLLLAIDSNLTGLYFDQCAHVPANRAGWKHNPAHPILKKAAIQLTEYFKGQRTKFDLPIHFEGTEFQQRVWEQIARIPFGQTITYSTLAQKAGRPEAIRAAGTNTSRNPIAIVIPCHRVLAKDGGIGGFAGGLPWKRHLLALENKSLVLQR